MASISLISKQKQKQKKIKTKHFKSVLSKEETKELFGFLRDNVNWTAGIKSRTGAKRLASRVSLDDSKNVITQQLIKLLKSITPYSIKFCEENKMNGIRVLGIYLNLYRDGKDSTPSHSHPKQVQVLVSLGQTRTLIVGKTEYKLEDGDIIMFGPSLHSVPIDDSIGERISIATFSSAF